MELNIDQDQDGGGGIKRKQKEHEQYFPPYDLVESQKKKVFISRSLWSHQVGLDVSSLLVLHCHIGKSTQSFKMPDLTALPFQIFL